MISKAAQQKIRKFTTWTIPLTYVFTTLIAGVLLPRIEHYLFPNLVTSMSVPAAMGVCGAVASGMIALTGIVFSLVFVMAQFSAIAYSPRLVLWIARDPAISHALGVFSATFLYSLFMLAWVDRNASGKVPMISSWMVFTLLLASMAVFILLIERIGQLQVSRMLIFLGEHGRKAIANLYAPHERLRTGIEKPDYRKTAVTQTVSYSGRPQVIQAVNVATLVKLASESGGVIEITSPVGESILDSFLLLRVYGAREKLNDEALGQAIDIGDNRTFAQDPKYAIRLIVDIALKALSAATNDPTTAVQALDQVQDLLLRLGRCRLDIGDYYDSDGALRVVSPFPNWEDYLRLGLDEILYCGASSVQVTRRMTALIQDLLTALPPERHVALRRWEARIQGTIRRTFADPEEKQEASVADRQGLGLGENQPRASRLSGDDWSGRFRASSFPE
jgi:uncharacterized membrane protein